MGERPKIQYWENPGFFVVVVCPDFSLGHQDLFWDLQIFGTSGFFYYVQYFSWERPNYFMDVQIDSTDNS